MAKNNAKILNIEPIIAAGINPATGLPYKLGSVPCTLKEDIRKFLRIIDEQDACNRYIWEGLNAFKLTSQEVERMIYYKGQLAIFYLEELKRFFILPYALNGGIDVYGRYNKVRPVVMGGGKDGKEENTTVSALLKDKSFEVIYDIEDERIEQENPNSFAVLIHDYTKQISQTIIPRVAINEPILTVMSECIPMMRTSLIASSGIKGVRVNDADQAASVKDGSRSIESAAMTGDPLIPIVGALEFQELTDHSTAKAEEYMLALQSLDNFRLSGYGIDNGGLFEKKAHVLEAEEAMNGGPVSLVNNDGLKIRKNACDIANKIWGLNLSVKINEDISPRKELVDNKEEPVEEEQGGNDDE